jgi:hypothetical protein
MFKSSDGGQHFQQLNRDPVGVRAIAIDPREPETVYVGGYHPLVYTSRDGGATFSAQVTEALVNQIAALVVDPGRPGTVYAGSDGGYTYSYYYFFAPAAPVMRSSDSGASWAAVLEQTERTPDPMLATVLAVDPRTGTLYAGTWDDPDASILRSADAGIQWDRFRLGVVGEIRALVVDPGRTSTLYAATTGAGVLRSVDAGASWAPMNEGLPSLYVGSLVLDPANGFLLAAADNNQVFRMRLDRRPSACTPTANRLCLLDSRYEVIVSATNRSGLGTPGAAIPGGDRYGAFSLPGLTGDSSLPEVFVKLIDNAPGARIQVFYGGLTTLAYSVVVTDTVSGHTETYRNDSGDRLCGGIDADAFFDPGGDACTGCWDYVVSKDAAGPEQNRALALLGNRFQVTLSAFSARLGRTERGVAVQGTDRYGYFSLPGFTGSNTFPEVYVKMVDFRALTGDFLLFHSGLTSLDYTLTVTDQETGEVRTFESHGDYCGGVEPLTGD